MTIASKTFAKSPSFRRGLLPVIALLIVGDATDGLASERVGAVGAANAGPTARGPNQPPRNLRPGDDVFFKDRIATGKGGSAQITLLDRSTLNVGENSEIVIDEFVYKPGAAGTMRAKLNRGMLRYVGGDISHGGGASVETPVATIGIRGGIGMIGYVKNAAAIAAVPGVPHDFTGGTIVVNSYGTMTVRGPSSEMVLRRSGFAVFINSNAQDIPTPVRLDMASAQALMKTLGSQKGQHGGASATARMKATTVTAAVGARFDVPVTQISSPSVNGLDYTAAFSAGDTAARVNSQVQQAGQLQQQLMASSVSVSAAPSTTNVTSVSSKTESSAVVTTPVVAPVATASVVTTPVVDPVVTTPVVASVATTPAVTSVAVTSVATTPVVTPVATTPVVTLVVTTPIIKLTVTAPVVKGHDDGKGNNFTNNGHGN